MSDGFGTFDAFDATLALATGKASARGGETGAAPDSKTDSLSSRVALDRSRRLRVEGAALEARAETAAKSPAVAVRESELERQIAELSVEAATLERRRGEIKHRAKLEAEVREEEEEAAAEEEDEEAAAAAAELLAPLTREQLDLIAEATGPGPTLEVIASGTFTGQGALEMTRKDVATMAPGEWLNDEMVNFTIGGMADRERARRGAEQPRVHFFNTFFVNKLCDGQDGYNYNAVRRWTTKKKLGYDLLACDKVIIPVHQGIHWVLAVVDLAARAIRFYDSLLGNDRGLVGDLKRWVRDEYKNKREEDVDASDWTVETPKDIPRQMNGCDCGVFMLKYADFIAVGAPLGFDQSDMGYFRKRIIADAMAKGKEL